MPTWPTELPQTLHVETEESADANVIVTDTAAGPRKFRRRFTAVSRFLKPPPER
ncbi:unnamed protein product, partial [marine sediment metagenome]